MMPPILLFAAGVAVITLAGGWAYRHVWIRLRGTEITPTGFGAFLAVAMLAGALFQRTPANVPAAFAVVTVATAIYWLDDLRELSARLRMAVSFATGTAICWLLLAGGAELPPWLVVSACVAAGGVNVVLTNIVNFYDGADLNLATFIALAATGVLALWGASGAITVSAAACLAFIGPFSIMNSRPRTIYLGDAGSFAFASLLTMMMVIFLQGRGELSPAVAIPLALPALDTFYVFCVRIIEKHDLLTRNYLHLYQRLKEHRPGFLYLVPQAVNVILVLAASRALEAAGLPSIIAVLLSMIGVTIPFYFACRRFLLPRTTAAGLS